MSDDIQKIKDRINITDVIGQYVQLKRAGRNFNARCPFHKERTPSFMVSPERGTYMCFGCGEKGDIFSFVQKMDGIDFGTALRQLAERAGVVLEQRFVRPAADKEKDERLHQTLEAATLFYEEQLSARKDVHDYLRTRGLSDSTIATWRLGYAPAKWEALTEHFLAKGFSADELVDAGLAVKSERPQEGKSAVFDRFRGRVMFPLFDAGGKVIAFSGRFFEQVPGQKSDGEPAKYVNSPETALFRKSRVLYGFDRARGAIRKADCTLLVEGQMDLLLSHQSGLPFTVALSGTALTPEHLTLLGRLSKRLVLALDADAAGLRSGLRSAQMAIAAGFDVKIPTFPAGKDPADVAKENAELLKAAVRTSKTAVEFFLEAIRPSAKDERSYRKLVEAQVLPLVSTIESRIEQEHFIAVVANHLGVSAEAVRAEVNKKSTGTLHAQAVSALTPGTTYEEKLSPFEKKAGMLLARFGKESVQGHKLGEWLGVERLGALEETIAPHVEALRFRFDAEVGEHAEETIATDMLSQLERLIAKERSKMKLL